jgi:hypothetical protein
MRGDPNMDGFDNGGEQCCEQQSQTGFCLCNNKPKWPKPEKFYQQGSAVIGITLNNPPECEGNCPTPFDLTDVTEIWVIFPTIQPAPPASPVPPIVKKLSLSQVTIVQAKLGQISVTLAGGLTGDTVNIPTGPVPVEVRPTVEGVTPFAQNTKQLICLPSLFPGT